MARWPDVPAVFGWLSLDRRGRWRLRGEGISNGAIVDFISRNYASDDAGRWFFQNGPQRAFVTLAYTPWVYRVDGAGRLVTHTGLAVRAIRGAYVDENMCMLLESEHGIGLVSDQDLMVVGDWLCCGGANASTDPDDLERALGRLGCATDAGLALRWGPDRIPLRRVRSGELPDRFGFVPQPREIRAEHAVHGPRTAPPGRSDRRGG